MKITRVSMFTGHTHTLEIPVTQEQLDRWIAGELIQNVMGGLSASDREFLMTGTTKEEWEAAFGPAKSSKRHGED